MALGATAQNVLWMIVGQTSRAVIIGAVIGVAAAAALSRVLSTVLFGISPADPVGIGGATLLVLGVAFSTSVIAAWPAMYGNPTTALRHD